MDEDESRSEATFRYKIENFNQLNDTTLSPQFFVRNIPWRIMAMPRTNQTEDVQNNKKLGFFLVCDEQSRYWLCNVWAELRLIAQREGFEGIERKIQHFFYSGEHDWGFSHFFGWKDIMESENGFIKNNAIILEVCVYADKPLGIRTYSPKLGLNSWIKFKSEMKIKISNEKYYSSKKLKSSEVQQKLGSNNMKDSYEERICDDLSEVILQYLSLEDKLRLECVSQQFRRTLFVKHYSLKITRKMREMSYESIENLMKKLPRLLEIYLSRYNDCKNINWKVIKAITESDKRLTKILFVEDFFPIGEDLNGFEEEQFIKFISRFSSEITSLDILELPWTFHIPYLEHFSNIEELVVPYVPDLTKVHFKHLKSLEIEELSEENTKDLNLLIESNENILRLRICDIKTENEIKIKLFLNSISKLKNLIELRIGSKILFNSKQFETHLTKIAQNCNHLKSLCIQYTIDENNSFADLLSSLKRFKALKRLNICLFFDTELTEEDMNSKFDFSSFNSFEVFRELTYLTIFSIPVNIEEKNIFKDIEKNLPKLQSIRIVGKINCSEYTAHILSQLSNLQTIDFLIKKESPKYEIETKLKENCKRIRNIHLGTSYDRLPWLNKQ